MQRNHLYQTWLKKIIIYGIVLLITMSIARLGFILYFGELSTLLNFKSDLLKAIILGIRYDLIIVSYVLALPFILIHFFQFLSKYIIDYGDKFLTWITYLFTIIIVWSYVFDYGFYSYFQDHLNILFFGFLEDDTKAVLVSIWKNYNLPLWLSLIIIILYFVYKTHLRFFTSHQNDPPLSSVYKVIIFVAGIIILPMAMRGNYSRLPLSVEDAHLSTNPFINKISLNGFITFNRAIKIRKVFNNPNRSYLKEYGFSSWQEALNVLEIPLVNNNEIRPNLIRKTSLKKNSSPHVVVVVMESFGSFWLKYQTDDFNLLGSLKKHFDEDYLNLNFLSSDNGTIGSALAVATGTVIRPGARYFSESDLMRTQLPTAINLPFQRAGYTTHFVYGGKVGWRDLGSYLNVQGFDGIHGSDEIKKFMPELETIPERDLGNEWGLFDEYLYQFIEEKISKSTNPQFFFVLTTSNHPPFEFPRTYEVKNLTINSDRLNMMTIDQQMALERFSSLLYANDQAGKFIDRIKTSELKDKVMISLTGDHSFWVYKNLQSSDLVYKNAVPFYLYQPKENKTVKLDSTKPMSHEDIAPTLYELALSEVDYVKLGESIFDEKTYAINSSDTIVSSHEASIEGNCYSFVNNEWNLNNNRTEECHKLKRIKNAWIVITDELLKETKNQSR